MTHSDVSAVDSVGTNDCYDVAITLVISEDVVQWRIDKALAQMAQALPAEQAAMLTRSRIQTLLSDSKIFYCPQGVQDHEHTTKTLITQTKHKVQLGEHYRIYLPPPIPMEPRPQKLPICVVYEDSHLLLVNKPAGMAAHPAPGHESGTLVNALLAHCGDSLSGIGGVCRPGIVHRIDKDTTGLMVVAKTDLAHQRLQAYFAAHTITREYHALIWGVPEAAATRIQGLEGVRKESASWCIRLPLGRHPKDRKRMAVRADGKHAVTRFTVQKRWYLKGIPFAAFVKCRLETGRTHQIRVHLSHLGLPLIGDPIYANNKTVPNRSSERLKQALKAFNRQALHAAHLGFIHPITQENLHYETDLPSDMAQIVKLLDSFCECH